MGEECMKLAAELASLKALLGKYQKNSGYTDKEVEKTAVNANDFDKKMTKDWTDHKDYKTYVEGDVHKATKNLTTAMQMSPQEEKKKFPIGSAVGRDQYAPDDNVTLAAMHKHQTKEASKAKKA